jgi:hypothetical protein
MDMARIDYSRYDDIPDYQIANWQGDEVIDDGTGRPKWSAQKIATPPAMGTRVTKIMNNLGAGKVCGYFTEHGWLGLLVRLDERTRPEWHVKQCGTSPDLAHIFGPECEVELTKPRGHWADDDL